MSTNVTIVIVTYNRQASLAETLLSISKQCVTPPDELIIVDQGSEFDHASVLEPVVSRGIKCTYLYSPYRCLAAARNIGLARVTTDIVLFLDDDVEILTDIVSAHRTRYVEDSAIVSTAGHVVVEPYNDEFVRLNTTTPSGRYVSKGRGCHMSFLKHTLESAGGFNAFITQCGDETEMFAILARRGLLVGNCPAAIVKHLVRPGGTRTLAADSFPWFMNYLRDNLARIGRLRGIVAAVMWPWLRFSRTLVIIRSGIAAGSVWQVWRAYWQGLILARIARATSDHVRLSLILSDRESGVTTPIDVASMRGRALVRSTRQRR